MKNKFHFWYSEGQKKVMRMKIKHALIKGEEVEYTECNKRKQVAGLWDDYKYLGKGIIYRINGILQ